MLKVTQTSNNINPRLFRVLVFSLVAFFFTKLSMAGASNGDFQRQIPILLYHHIADDTPKSTSVSPEYFAQHMAWLKRENYQVLALDDVVERLQNNQPFPDKSVAITFDDAYQSIFTNAFPILKKHQFPFTVFTATEGVDKNYSSLMNWEQLQILSENGAIIANHGHQHLHYIRRPPSNTQTQWLQLVAEDFEQGKDLIKKHIGTQHGLFAYPYGEFDLPTQELMKQRKMVAFAQHSGPASADSPLQALPRFAISSQFQAIEDFVIRIRSLALPISSMHPESTLLASDSKPPTFQIKLSEPLKNLQQMQCYLNGQANNVKLEAPTEQTFKVVAIAHIPSGRSRINCTLWHAPGVFYWHSIPLFKPDKAGLWPNE